MKTIKHNTAPATQNGAMLMWVIRENKESIHNNNNKNKASTKFCSEWSSPWSNHGLRNAHGKAVSWLITLVQFLPHSILLGKASRSGPGDFGCSIVLNNMCPFLITSITKGHEVRPFHVCKLVVKYSVLAFSCSTLRLLQNLEFC